MSETVRVILERLIKLVKTHSKCEWHHHMALEGLKWVRQAPCLPLSFLAPVTEYGCLTVSFSSSAWGKATTLLSNECE